MILLDANILIYALAGPPIGNEKVRLWLFDNLAGDTAVGVPWISIWAYLRVVTNRNAFGAALTIADATTTIHRLLENRSVEVINPGPSHLEILTSLLRATGVTGRHITDAAIAALALEQGASLASADRIFAKFDQLHWINPLDPR